MTRRRSEIVIAITNTQAVLCFTLYHRMPLRVSSTSFGVVRPPHPRKKHNHVTGKYSIPLFREKYPKRERPSIRTSNSFRSIFQILQSLRVTFTLINWRKDQRWPSPPPSVDQTAIKLSHRTVCVEIGQIRLPSSSSSHTCCCICAASSGLLSSSSFRRYVTRAGHVRDCATLTQSPVGNRGYRERGATG